jgi:hypothetical protein
MMKLNRQAYYKTLTTKRPNAQTLGPPHSQTLKLQTVA